MSHLNIAFEQLGRMFEGEIIKKSLIFEDALSNTHKDARFMLYKDKPPNPIFQGLGYKSNPTLNTHEFDVDARGGIHHHLRPLEVVDDQQVFQQKLSLKTCRFVSYLASNVENFESYYFDYGGLAKETCIWIDNGPHELPQLLISHDNFPKFENEVVNIF